MPLSRGTGIVVALLLATELARMDRSLRPRFVKRWRPSSATNRAMFEMSVAVKMTVMIWWDLN